MSSFRFPICAASFRVQKELRCRTLVSSRTTATIDTWARPRRKKWRQKPFVSNFKVFFWNDYPGVNVMITVFTNFYLLSAKKLPLF
jgi:hypothetical protein